MLEVFVAWLSRVVQQVFTKSWWIPRTSSICVTTHVKTCLRMDQRDINSRLLLGFKLIMLFGSASAPVLSCEMGRFGDLLFSIGVKRRLVIAVVVVQEHHRIFLELHRPWGHQMGEKTPDENHEWPWWSCLLYECYWGFDLFWLFPLETVSLDRSGSGPKHHLSSHFFPFVFFTVTSVDRQWARAQCAHILACLQTSIHLTATVNRDCDLEASQPGRPVKYSILHGNFRSWKQQMCSFIFGVSELCIFIIVYLHFVWV